MQIQGILTTTFFVLVTADVALSCSVVDWRHMSMEEILSQSEIVVYGREVQRNTVPDDEFPGGRQDADFEVYCVLKDSNKNNNISSTITIYQVDPRPTCSGTEVTLNEDVILSLKHRGDGTYEWDEPNVAPDGAAFKADAATLQEVSQMDCLSKFAPPAGQNNEQLPSCPTQSSTYTLADVGKCKAPNNLSFSLNIYLVTALIVYASINMLCYI